MLPEFDSKGGTCSSKLEEQLLPPVLESFLSNFGRSESKTFPTSPGTSAVDIETQGRLSLWFSQADTDPFLFKGMGRRQRLLGFLICLLCASICLSLAVVFLPIIVTPSGLRKYVLLHTVGSLLLVCSFTFLWGPLNHIRSLMSYESLPFTLGFISSLFLGLYAVIVWKSAVFAALALFCQIGLIIWKILTSIPGGKAGLLAICRGGIWSIKNISPKLPI